MRPWRTGQAVIETAIVIPVMLAMTLGFIALMIQVRAQSEFQTALNLAAQATLRASRGEASLSAAFARFAFHHTLDPRGREAGYLRVSQEITCRGDYLDGLVSMQPVVCTASADLDFAATVIAIFWRRTVHMTGTGTAQPPYYRQCGPEC